jgi:alpha-ketoglutarate-dependent taurine dioxygenase
MESNIGPASLAQEGLWFETMLGGRGVAYHEPLLLALRGPLDRRRMGRSLNAVLERHAALRTTFDPGPDGLQQRAAPVQRVTLSDVVELPGDLAARARYFQEFICRPFDLAAGPLLRVQLARASDDEHVLVIVAHHAIVDGWSLGLFCRDLSAFFVAYPDTAAADLPTLRSDCLSYARRQRAFIGTAEADRSAEFWRGQLSGLPGPLFPAPPRVAPGAGRLASNIDTTLLPDIGVVARRLRVSVFCVALAAFAAALARVTGKTDFVVGTDFSDRVVRGEEDLIGLFVNQLPVAIRCRPARTGEEFVRLAQASWLAAVSHKDLPYPLIRRAAGQGGGASAADFEAKLVLHNAPHRELSLPGIVSEWLEVEPSQAKFPLLLEFWQTPGSLRGWLVFDRRRICEELAAALLEAFQVALQSVARSPQAPMSGAREPRGAFKPSRQPLPPPADLVRIEVSDEPGVPAMFSANTAGVDLVSWAAANETAIAKHLLASGALLFRGFQVDGARGFGEAVAQVGGSPAMSYTERTTPRTQIEQGIYTSTEYPADQEIFFHNENAYAATWPSHIYFWCEVPPAGGGHTPLADCRRVLTSLPEQLRTQFQQLGVLYRRRFRAGLGIEWQQAFGVASAVELAQRFEPAGYRFEWLQDDLVATFRAPAIVSHPLSGAESWFNHAGLFHRAALPPQVRQTAEDGGASVLQVETRFGDDSPIPDGWIALIRAAYRKNAAQFEWRRNDLLVLDNRTVAHGRTPFNPPRRILAAMTGPANHRSSAS